MKKKLIITIVISILLGAAVSAQSVEMKRYRDYLKDYSGVATSMYLGVYDDEQTISKFDERVELLNKNFKRINKFTKKYQWLLEKAIDEWAYENGERYMIMMAEDMDSESFILVFIECDQIHYSVTGAWLCTIEEMQKFQKKYEQ